LFVKPLRVSKNMRSLGVTPSIGEIGVRESVEGKSKEIMSSDSSHVHSQTARQGSGKKLSGRSSVKIGDEKEGR
jgi:hypothetical protein